MKHSDMPKLVYLTQHLNEHAIAAYYGEDDTARWHKTQLRVRLAEIEALVNPQPVASEGESKLLIEEVVK